MRAMSSAQMPAGVMPYGVPAVDQRVPHARRRRSASTQIS